MKKMRTSHTLMLICAVCGALLLGSCTRDEEPFGESFVYLADENGNTSAEIGRTAATVSTYWVYLSTRRLSEREEVYYEFQVGSGLKEGVDFKQVPTTASPLIFMPGIYEMPVRIEWLSNADLDPAGDNTLRIVLTGTSSGFTLGYPGPAQRGKEYVITKK